MLVGLLIHTVLTTMLLQVGHWPLQILFTFDQTGRVDAQLKAKAVYYCDEVIQNPACLALCIERYGSSSYMEVRFWCLQTLHEVGAAARLRGLEWQQYYQEVAFQ